MATPGRGVGALDPDSTAELRDALLAAASEVHSDAGSVLSSAPDVKDAAPLGWLRPSPGADGGDLETHVAVALFWGLFRAERRAARAVRLPRTKTPGRLRAIPPSAAASARVPATPPRPPRAVTVVSAYGLERRLVPLELAAALADAIPPDARRRLLVDARPAPGDSGVIHLTTRAVYEARRAAGSLRCAACGRFLPGDRALCAPEDQTRPPPLRSRRRRRGRAHGPLRQRVDPPGSPTPTPTPTRRRLVRGLRKTKDADDLARGLAAARAAIAASGRARQGW